MNASSGFHLFSKSPSRRVLLLKGHPSQFWSELAETLIAQRIEVHKVHLCLADHVFWRAGRAHSYRGKYSDWEQWLESFVTKHRITDIIYYADRFPYHKIARAVAERRNRNAWAVEFGYLRPDWLTFEPGGMGQYSTLGRQPQAITKRAAGVAKPDMAVRFSHCFRVEAANEVLYGLVEFFGRPFYPHYRSDRRYCPVLDYLSWVPKLLLSPFMTLRAKKVEKGLARTKAPYNLVAMQIEGDYQIRDNSPFDTAEDFLEEVLSSFAKSAPHDRQLVIKLHPLDSGLDRAFSRSRKAARRHGLHGRVHVIRGGNLAQLIKGSLGVVTINSTTGLGALRQQVPVVACGHAVYDMSGLTHQGGLDTFWIAPDPVNKKFLTVFLRALSTVQIKGSFFHPKGRREAATSIAARLAALPHYNINAIQ